jgi:hypothetical protein
LTKGDEGGLDGLFQRAKVLPNLRFQIFQSAICH